MDERTVLFGAVKENNTDIVKLFLEFGADPNIICRLGKRNRCYFRWSALHEASRLVEIMADFFVTSDIN